MYNEYVVIILRYDPRHRNEIEREIRKSFSLSNAFNTVNSSIPTITKQLILLLLI